MKTIRIPAQAWAERPAIAPIAAMFWLCFATTMLAGGEKIQITDTPEKLEAPGKVLHDDLFSKPLDFLKSRGGDSVSSLVPSLPPAPPSSTLQKDLLEKKTRFLNPRDDQDQDAALKQIFGVREYNLDSLRKTSRQSAEDLWDGQSARKPQTQQNRLFDAPISRRETDRERRDRLPDPGSRARENDSAARSDSLFENDGAAGNAPIAELNFHNLLHPAQVQDTLSLGQESMNATKVNPSSIGRLFNPASAGGPSERDHEQELRTQAFEKLLKGPRTLAKPASDPINSLADGTRQELNPVRGKRLDDYSTSAMSPMGPDALSGVARASRPGLFDSLNTRVLGASSLAPTVVAPSAPPRFEVKPPVLEIPRRKF